MTEEHELAVYMDFMFIKNIGHPSLGNDLNAKGNLYIQGID